ncbi:MAG: ABC transporter ATP-binding protein [Oscillibacter sp.]|nr:ABC transporter ATP-binding protein [Oscillibacter sp.]
MLEIRHLQAGYPGKPVLQDVSLSIPSQKVTVILGPNGCGKSTLLRAICGVLPASGGEVFLDGEALLTLPPKLLARKTAYLPQSRRVPDITARTLVLHGRFPYLGYPRRYRREDYRAAEEAMAQMGVTALRDSSMSQLSGGQRQKIYIAMALAQDTPVILLDEPTTYLDIYYQIQMIRQAKDLARQGKTVVMVVHDLSRAMTAADHIVLMDHGTVIMEGTPEEIYASGKLNSVFHITLERTPTDSGWHYYCREG